MKNFIYSFLLIFFSFYSLIAQEYAVGFADSSIVASCGAGVDPWNAPSNIQQAEGPPNDMATFAFMTIGGTTECLQLLNYNFNIPSDATITGVKAFVYKKSQGIPNSHEDERILLRIGDGVFGSDNKAQSGFWNAIGLGIYPTVYGSSNDVWGASLTPAVVNSPEFGISIEVENLHSTAVRPLLDAVEIQVYYNRCTSDRISGHVFNDLNMDGNLDDHLEFGVDEIIVSAFDDNETLIARDTTNAFGTYFLDIPSGTPTRLEFSNQLSNLLESVVGQSSNSSVQFVSSPACDINFGVHNPGQYCHSKDDLKLATVCFVQYGQDTETAVSFDYNSGIDDPGSPPPAVNDWETYKNPLPDSLSYASETGATWGIAWNSKDSLLYTSSFLKHTAVFGPEGPGGIYQISMDPSTGLRSGPPSLLVDIEDLGINVCEDLHANDTLFVYEEAVFQNVGKCSLGDIDISDDDQFLYVMNLATREILEITLGATPSLSNSWTFPLDQLDCTGNPDDIRPFALKYNDGFIYAGAVCTGESTADDSALRAYVYRLDLSTGNFDQIVNYELDILPRTWRAWADDYTDWNDFVDFSFRYETPWLTDIEFNGQDMILGFRDRAGDQFGSNMPWPDTNVFASLASPSAMGDVQKVCYNPITDLYEVERNGRCGQHVANGRGGYTLTDVEFYWADGLVAHDEIGNGGLFQLPYDSILVYSAMNTPNGLNAPMTNAGGIFYQNNFNGEADRAYLLYRNADVNFAKAAGMGDVEGLCLPAPIEIGNLVWNDLDNDGIQDPSEPPISGVNLFLYDNSGNQIATTTTDSNGNYVFNWTNVLTGLDYQSNYFISFDPIQYSSTGLNAGGTDYGFITVSNTGSTANSDWSDSDLLNDSSSGISDIDSNSVPYISLTTGPIGMHDHTFDLGLYKSDCPILLSVIGDIITDQCFSGNGVDISYSATVNSGENGVDYTIQWTVEDTIYTGVTSDLLTLSLIPENGCTPLISPEVKAQIYCLDESELFGSEIVNSSTDFTVFPVPVEGLDYSIENTGCSITITDECGSLIITNDLDGNNDYEINIGDEDQVINFTINTDLNSPEGCKVVEQLNLTCPCPGPDCLGITIIKN